MPRRKKLQKPVLFPINLEEGQLESLRAIALRKRASVADLIREAVEMYLRDVEEGKITLEPLGEAPGESGPPEGDKPNRESGSEGAKGGEPGSGGESVGVSKDCLRLVYALYDYLRARDATREFLARLAQE